MLKILAAPFQHPHLKHPMVRELCDPFEDSHSLLESINNFNRLIELNKVQGISRTVTVSELAVDLDMIELSIMSAREVSKSEGQQSSYQAAITQVWKQKAALAWMVSHWLESSPDGYQKSKWQETASALLKRFTLKGTELKDSSVNNVNGSSVRTLTLQDGRQVTESPSTKLGAGAFGEVIEGKIQHSNLPENSDVAIKTVLAKNLETLVQTIRECFVWELLTEQKTGVLPLIAIITAQFHDCPIFKFVMPKGQKPLSRVTDCPSFLTHMKQLLPQFKALRSLGLGHGDFSDRNTLICTPPATIQGEAQLIDFGFSTSNQDHLRLAGTYRSPASITHPSDRLDIFSEDSWAFGVTLLKGLGALVEPFYVEKLFRIREDIYITPKQNRTIIVSFSRHPGSIWTMSMPQEANKDQKQHFTDFLTQLNSSRGQKNMFLCTNGASILNSLNLSADSHSVFRLPTLASSPSSIHDYSFSPEQQFWGYPIRSNPVITLQKTAFLWVDMHLSRYGTTKEEETLGNLLKRLLNNDLSDNWLTLDELKTFEETDFSQLQNSPFPPRASLKLPATTEQAPNDEWVENHKHSLHCVLLSMNLASDDSQLISSLKVVRQLSDAMAIQLGVPCPEKFRECLLHNVLDRLMFIRDTKRCHWNDIQHNGMNWKDFTVLQHLFFLTIRELESLMVLAPKWRQVCLLPSQEEIRRLYLQLFQGEPNIDLYSIHRFYIKLFQQYRTNHL